jgi:hypothetical protein
MPLKDGTTRLTIGSQSNILLLLNSPHVFLREQSRFEIDIDIERLHAGEEPRKKRKFYANLDSNIEEYLTRIAMNLNLSA